MKRIGNNSFLRFLIVGGTSTGCDFCTYMILSRYININVAKWLSMTFFCTAVFFFNKRWTFQDSRLTDRIQVIKYIVSQIVNVMVNVGINGVIYHITGIKIVSYAFAIICTVPVNYLLQKMWVFKSEKKNS